MSKKHKPSEHRREIGKDELQEFLVSGAADFAFEMECLRAVEQAMFEHINRPNCSLQFSGTYVDPLKQINREFDIRLSFEGYNHQSGFKLAIECKNIAPEFPLLVYCIPRAKAETKFDQVVSVKPYPGMALRPKAVYSPYHVNKPVGKSCTQVGMEELPGKGGQTTRTFASSDDDGIYNKWSQALASLEAMLQDYLVGLGGQISPVRWIPLPVVVVPNERLWVVEFGETGMQKSLQHVERVQYYVGKQLTTLGTGVTVGHVEFVTVSGLKSLISDLLENLGCNSRWFELPKE